MTEPSPATPEPLRRRRSRDRAPGGTGEDDSWAHLVGLGRPWDTEGGQGEADRPAGRGAAPRRAEPAAGPGNGRAAAEPAGGPPPRGRGRARRGAAPAPARGPVEEPSVPLDRRVPARPAGASDCVPGGPRPVGSRSGRGGPADGGARRGRARGLPATGTAGPAAARARATPGRDGPASRAAAGQPLARAGAPGAAAHRPLRVRGGPGPTDVGRGGHARSGPEPPRRVPRGRRRRRPPRARPRTAFARPGEVVLPVRPIPPWRGPSTGPARTAAHQCAATARGVRGRTRSCRTPELPGPVLPGVERFTEPTRTAGEQAPATSEPAATPLGRRRARTAVPARAGDRHRDDLPADDLGRRRRSRDGPARRPGAAGPIAVARRSAPAAGPFLRRSPAAGR